MKLVLLLGLTLGIAGTAWAEAPKASCIDSSQSYAARPLNHHDVFVQNTFGKRKPPVRVTTSCSHLDPALGFGFSRGFNCIGQGDTVVADIPGGGHETCRVTRVVPYAPAGDDIPQKK